MKYWLLHIIIALSILSCKKYPQPEIVQVQKIDSVAIKTQSTLVKNRIDSLIFQKKVFGSISCGTKFSFEEYCDSSDRRIKSILYYTTSDSYSASAISSYFANEELVFINIKYTTDRSDLYSVEVEQNIYVDGEIQIKEQVLGNMNELPSNVQEVIENTL